MKQEIISNDFDNKYPNITDWVTDGLIEIGHTEYTDSFIRVLDEGGMIWEGKTKYTTMDEAISAAEKACAKWFEENS